ncbi:hypothetical protein [Aquimarina algicola]|uniref:Uncharacterized protein n=1 Tax=Aquimarina algicola TaxID=2589995 RepID=A0A504J7L7_9FLAO|nr:hypothetical protein [Aquimarina algicola]TPN83888.1 hypothetical protein FHK87_18145 [Aquimarina algicola]
MNVSLVNQEKYFREFDISFSGIVKEKIHISNGAGIVTLDVSTSDTDTYDVRNEYKSYLCIIQDKKAEVIMNRLFLIRINDSLVIDSNEKKIKLYRDGLIEECWGFQLPVNSTFFYTFVRWKHKL